MNILICHRPQGAFGYISDGWINALRDMGHQAVRWDAQETTWREFSPDLYVGCSGHRQKIPHDRGNCKVVIHVNPYGPHRIEPNINEPADAIKWVREQKPDLVFGYGCEANRELWSDWDKIGIGWVGLPTAADVTIYKPQGNHDDYDLVWVGGRWDYKAQNIDKYLLPVFQSGKFSMNAHGWGDWPVAGIGQIDDDKVPQVLSSGKVGPCVSEPHTTTWGIDVPERVFKVIASGAVAIHDKVKGLDNFFTTVPSARSPEHFFGYIEQIVNMTTVDRAELAAEQYLELVDKHTYHHRMDTLLEALK